MAAHKIIDEPGFQKRRAERFWLQIDRSGGPDACWPWLGTRLAAGYGSVTFLGERTTAHRIAWQLDHGDALGSLSGLHSCDSPPCCNPKHVYPGTQAEKLSDMHARGMAYRLPALHGENHGRCAISDADVTKLRAEYAAGGITQQQLAKPK